MTDEPGKTSKLPAHLQSKLPAASADMHSPVDGRSIVGKFFSGIVARLNKRTLDDGKAEVKAQTAFIEAKGELADAAVVTLRKVNRYRIDTPSILENDRQDHADQLREAENQRKLAELRRQAELESAQRALERSRMEGDLDYHKSLASKQAEVAEANARRIRSEFYRRLQTLLVPIREKRLTNLYETGAIDAELDRMVAEGEREQKNGKTSTGQSVKKETIDQLIAEINEQITLAHATHASEAELGVLYQFLSRLKAKRESA